MRSAPALMTKEQAQTDDGSGDHAMTTGWACSTKLDTESRDAETAMERLRESMTSCGSDAAPHDGLLLRHGSAPQLPSPSPG